MQATAPRFFAAFVFVGVTLLHEVFLADADGLLYYGSAALFDLAIVILLSGVHPLPKMVLALQQICIVSIFVNLFGWVLWVLYLPPTAYNTSFVLLYFWALLALINRGANDVGGYTMASWATCFRFHRRTRGMGLFKHGGET